MDKDTFKVLRFLSGHIFGSVIDIRKTVNKIFPYRKGMSEQDFNVEMRLIIRFLEGIEKLNYVNFNHTRAIEPYYKSKTEWFEDGKLKVLLQLEGLRAVNNEKFNKSIKNNSRTQTIVIVGAFVISAASLCVSILNYRTTLGANANSQKQQYLLPSKELIEQLNQKPIKSLPEKPNQIIQNPSKSHLIYPIHP